MVCTPSSSTALPNRYYDYDQPPILYFLDLLAMMGLWIALSYCLGKALRSRAGHIPHQSPISEADNP